MRGVLGIRDVGGAFGLLHILGGQSFKRGQQVIHARVEEVRICLAEADPAVPVQDKERAGTSPPKKPVVIGVGPGAATLGITDGNREATLVGPWVANTIREICQIVGISRNTYY